MTRFPALLIVAFLFTATSAEAYIGPGLGAGVIATVLGILGSMFLALFAIVWYPIKRLFKRKASRQEPPAK
jgi:hypothetical protein